MSDEPEEQELTEFEREDRNDVLEEAAVAAESYGEGIYGDPNSEAIAKFTARRIAEGIRGMKT